MNYNWYVPLFNCFDSGVVNKFLLFAVFSCIFPFSGNAQYSNNWVNFSQQYYKIPIGKNGIYQLSYANLQAGGFPVASVDPRLVQLFHRGVEQAIVIQGQSDGTFNAGDYIQFYAQRNDGTLDSLLYQPSSYQPHKYYNLYSDTSAYFLTWNLTGNAGKRMSTFTQNNVTGIPVEPYQKHQELDLYVGQYSAGNTIDDGEIENTFFDQGEGWTDNYICTQNSGCTGFQDYVIQNLINGVSSTTPTLDVLIVGRDELNHQTQVWVGPNSTSLRLTSTQTFINFQTQFVTTGLNATDIGPTGTLTVEVRALGVDGVRDKVSVSYIKVIWPQSFDVTGLTKTWLTLNANPSGKSYIEMTNPTSGLGVWDITDPNNILVIGTKSAGNILSAVVPNTTTARQLFVSSEINTPTFEPVTFQQINAAAYNYIIITHSTLLNAAQTYASYRASTGGGQYSPLVITVDQLYNQFNYGEISPLGIFQFMKFMVANSSPKYLFLIGKGRDVSDGYYREVSIPPTERKELVPTAGFPASDMAFTANLNGSGFAPAVATGRLSASSPNDVTTYLNKVQTMESTPLNALWRKQGLHLSGGILPEELTQFRSYMDGFKSIAQGPYWGAMINTIGKQQAEPVQEINISNQINAGVNLVTFFGHSSPGTIDIDIGYASDPTLGYNNPGKYPVFLINGCNAGNFFTSGTSFGEDWMLAANKGARGFIADSFFGFVNNLDNYSNLFYSIGFADSTFIQKGIGDVQKQVAVQYLQEYGSDMADETQVQQMVLLGDPAVKLFGAAKPDYETDDTAISLISLDGKPVTALSDSFAIHVIVKNFGAAIEVPLQVQLVRTYSDNTTRTYDSTFAPVLFQDTLIFKLRKEKSTGFGSNQFKVTLDYQNLIKELDKTNNTGSASFVIPLGGTQNLYPVPYAIVNTPVTNLLFQSSEPLSGTRNFQVQIDTSSSFNSPFLIQQTVSGKVLASFSVNLLPQDSVVYYWQTKFDQPNVNESTSWTASSFTYIGNSPTGWMQRKFPQLNQNTISGLVENANSQQLDFIENSTSLLVTTYGDSSATPYTSVSVKVDNQEYNLATQGDPCRNNTIDVMAFDKTTLSPVDILNLIFQDPRNCGRSPEVIFDYAPTDMDDGTNSDFIALVDSIPTSDSVLIFSIGNAGYSTWSPNIISTLAQLGIAQSQLSTLQDGDPVVILGRKGAPAGTAKVFQATASPANAQPLQTAATLTGGNTSGEMTSVVIGPALRWKQLIAQARDIQTSDQYNFSLSGLTLDGHETVLQSNVPEIVDLTSISAQQYPYLKLTLQTEDDITLSPVQLRQWIVVYDPVAEGVLFYNGPPNQQVVSEGQTWTGAYSFVNISAQSFTDSLTVNFELLNGTTLSSVIRNFKIAAPPPGDSTNFTVSTNTRGEAGLNDVDVYVNPKILPEQYYENNVIDLGGYLNIKGDTIAPVLDVTIDGRYLVNNDFVSPNPVIQIKLIDEDPYLLKTDTTGITIVLTYPCSATDCTGQQIFFSRSDVQWFPATATSDFRIEFTPKNLPDGEYILFVQAADESGNLSGSEPYQVNFQVENEITFAFQSVYPNPSSSLFFFNFVVTGNQVPESFGLNVYAFDGRLLQQFTIADISDFHIGTNQLIWDPTDNSGPMVPSGMYVFRMQLSIQGKEYSQTGKLILIR